MFGKLLKFFFLLIVISGLSAAGFYYLAALRSQNQELAAEIGRLQKREGLLVKEKENLIQKNSETEDALAGLEKNNSQMSNKISPNCSKESCLFVDTVGVTHRLQGYVRVSGFYQSFGGGINGIDNNCAMFIVQSAPEEFINEAEFESIPGGVFESNSGTLKMALETTDLSAAQQKLLQKSSEKKPVVLSLVTDENLLSFQRGCKTYLRAIEVR